MLLDNANVADGANACAKDNCTSCLVGTVIFVLAAIAYIIAVEAERCQMHGQLCDQTGEHCIDVDNILNCGIRAVMEITANASIALTNCGQSNITAPAFNRTVVQQLVTRGFLSHWDCPTDVSIQGSYLPGDDLSLGKVTPK